MVEVARFRREVWFGRARRAAHTVTNDVYEWFVDPDHVAAAHTSQLGLPLFCLCLRHCVPWSPDPGSLESGCSCKEERRFTDFRPVVLAKALKHTAKTRVYWSRERARL